MESYDPYELMITPSNKKGEMLIDEIRKPEPNLNLKLKMQLNLF